MKTQPLDHLPLGALFAITVVLFAVAVVGGYWLVRWRQMKAPAKSDAGVGSIAGATLALLAFLLAFLIGNQITVARERRTLSVSEANAIGTTYLRAGYLEEPYRTESRSLLIEYVDQRVAALDPDKLAAAKSRSEEIHTELWALAEQIVNAGNTAATTGLYISTLNDVIDLHTERVVAGGLRAPPLLVVAFYAIAFGAMFLIGMQIGYGENRSIVALSVLVLVLSVVMYLIVDLDRPGEGLLKVPEQVMIDLQAQIGTLP